tara:strand:- start:9548 stop:10948 length:1401 start_codon:yes stop_codon:yes gene_type:complete
MLTVQSTTGLQEHWEQLGTQWRTNPTQFVQQALNVTPEKWQAEALTALCTEDRIACRSGHGVGKSAFAAWTILWWMYTKCPSKVAVTAPTSHQLQDILWSELATWHRKMPDFLQDLFELTATRFYLKEKPDLAFSVPRVSRPEKPEAFQGFHSENMLFIIDEASGVDEVIFEVGQGAMSTKGAKTLMVGNPTRTDGYFFDAFHSQRANWWTKRISCADSTRVDPKFIEEMASKYGTDSAIFAVRVLGDFPEQSDDAIISLALCESAIRRDVEPLEGFPTWGLDVARFGDDATALAKRQRNVMLEPVKSWRNKSVTQVAGLVIDEYLQTPTSQRPAKILIDSIGIGSGVVDILQDEDLPAIGINVAESPSVRARFMRLRDELWFRGREWLEALDCKMIDDPDLIGELTAPRYAMTASGKIQVEPKDKTKQRLGGSPDLADAFLLTFASPDHRHAEDHFYEPEYFEDS